MFSSMATITSEAWTNQCPKNVNTYLHTYLVSFKTLIGSLFPLLPLRVKCQNHERVPISPISPILVVYVFSSCQDMDHQNRGNMDPLMVLPGWSAKTMRGSLFPLFPLFWWSMSSHLAKTWTTKIGEIGTLSWFWHFTQGKRWEGTYFPYCP